MSTVLIDAPRNMARALTGLPLAEPCAREGLPVELMRDEHFREHAMSNFICAALDNDSAHWSDYNDAANSELASTSEGEAAAWGRDPRDYMPWDRHDPPLQDTRLTEVVRRCLPHYSDLRARPSDNLRGGANAWCCPEPDCAQVIDPVHLDVEAQHVVKSFTGHLRMLLCDVDGVFSLRTGDHEKFLRYIDALVWDHVAWHLRREYVCFRYPHPEKPYTEIPCWFWDDDDVAAHATPQIQEDIARSVRFGQVAHRRWVMYKAIRSANRFIHRAQVRLTTWRRTALDSRRELVRDMFQEKRGVVEVGLALLARIRQQESDPTPAAYRSEIAHYKHVKMESHGLQSAWNMYM